MLVLAVAAALSPASATAGTGPQHAIAMHGAPAMPAGFSARPYVNQDAPKGGRLTLGVPGTFDTVNPLVVRGLSVPNIRGYVIEGLMARGYDEPFTLYGLIAETVETDDERTFVTFNLNPRARFSDGKPVTPEDVVFTWQLLRDKGRPNYRTYYAKVVRAEFRGDHLHSARHHRSLCHQVGRSRTQRHFRAQSGLLGRRSSDQPRPLEFRRNQIRLLSRREFVVRSLQEGALRHPR
jgi:peptide/nickel transport system substrate-binding protein